MLGKDQQAFFGGAKRYTADQSEHRLIGLNLDTADLVWHNDFFLGDGVGVALALVVHVDDVVFDQLFVLSKDKLVVTGCEGIVRRVCREDGITNLARHGVSASDREVSSALLHCFHLSVMVGRVNAINDRYINIELRNDQPWVGADSGIACWIDNDVLWINIAWGGIGGGDTKQDAIVLQKDERQ